MIQKLAPTALILKSQFKFNKIVTNSRAYIQQPANKKPHL
jgi:hypothetical protein